MSLMHLKTTVTQQEKILLKIQILMDHAQIEVSCTWVENEQQL